MQRMIYGNLIFNAPKFLHTVCQGNIRLRQYISLVNYSSLFGFKLLCYVFYSYLFKRALHAVLLLLPQYLVSDTDYRSNYQIHYEIIVANVCRYFMWLLYLKCYCRYFFFLLLNITSNIKKKKKKNKHNIYIFQDSRGTTI